MPRLSKNGASRTSGQQQDSFFRQHVISGVAEHTIQRGESIWIIALRKYKVPVWLFRQYNPALDMHKVQPGTQYRSRY